MDDRSWAYGAAYGRMLRLANCLSGGYVLHHYTALRGGCLMARAEEVRLRSFLAEGKTPVSRWCLWGGAARASRSTRLPARPPSLSVVVNQSVESRAAATRSTAPGYDLVASALIQTRRSPPPHGARSHQLPQWSNPSASTPPLGRGRERVCNGWLESRSARVGSRLTVGVTLDPEGFLRCARYRFPSQRGHRGRLGRRCSSTPKFFARSAPRAEPYLHYVVDGNGSTTATIDPGRK